MDVGTILGLVIALGAIGVSVHMDGGHLGALVSNSALVLIFGGTIGAVMIQCSLREVLRAPKVLLACFKPPKLEPVALVNTMVSLAERARRDGLLALQDDMETIDNPLLQRGLAMVVDGGDPEAVADALENEVHLRHDAWMRSASVLDTAGGYGPTIGIIGTVMGLIHVLSNLSDAEKLGPAIAVAFLATFYGVASANLIFLPLAGKIKDVARQEQRLHTMIIEGLAGLQVGEAPRALREKLEVYLITDGRKIKPEAAATGTEAVRGEA